MGYSGIQIEQILLHIILVVHRVACSVVRSSGTVRLARPPLRWQKKRSRDERAVGISLHQQVRVFHPSRDRASDLCVPPGRLLANDRVPVRAFVFLLIKCVYRFYCRENESEPRGF